MENYSNNVVKTTKMIPKNYKNRMLLCLDLYKYADSSYKRLVSKGMTITIVIKLDSQHF